MMWQFYAGKRAYILGKIRLQSLFTGILMQMTSGMVK